MNYSVVGQHLFLPVAASVSAENDMLWMHSTQSHILALVVCSLALISTPALSKLFTSPVTNDKVDAPKIGGTRTWLARLQFFANARQSVNEGYKKVARIDDESTTGLKVPVSRQALQAIRQRHDYHSSSVCRLPKISSGHPPGRDQGEYRCKYIL